MSLDEEKLKWVCPNCGESEAAWSQEVLDVRVSAHMSRHGLAIVPMARKSYDINKLNLSAADEKWLKGMKISWE